MRTAIALAALAALLLLAVVWYSGRSEEPGSGDAVSAVADPDAPVDARPPDTGDDGGPDPSEHGPGGTRRTRAAPSTTTVAGGGTPVAPTSALVVRLTDARGGARAGAALACERVDDLDREPVPVEAPRADAAGRVALEALAPGRYRVRPVPLSATAVPDFVRANPAAHGDGWVYRELAAGARDELELVVPTQVAVRGAVLLDHEPLPEAAVVLTVWERGADDAPGHLDEPLERATTDATGRFALEAVAPGTYTLGVLHAERCMRTELMLQVGETDLEYTVELDTLVVEGTVRGADGAPVVDALVLPVRVRRTEGGEWVPADEPERWSEVSAGTSGWARTDAEGRYALRGLAPFANLWIEARHPLWRADHTDPFQLDPGDSHTRVDFELAPAGGVRATIASAGGEPDPSLQLAGTPLEEGGAVERVTSAALGAGETLELTGLAPGRWRIELTSFLAGFRAPAPVEVEVVAGELAPLRFVVP